MKPTEFVEKYWASAKAIERKTGLSALAQLTQGALESGWGSIAPCNNFFGIKDLDGTCNGNEQLLDTTEFLPNERFKFPVVKSIVKKSARLFKYAVKDYFAVFKSPEDAFAQHAKLFLLPRYSKAWDLRKNPEKFLVEVAKAGYATDPKYAELLLAVLASVKKAIVNSKIGSAALL